MTTAPLPHMTPEQRETYAACMDRLAGNKRGPLPDRLREGAKAARGNFYEGVDLR